MVPSHDIGSNVIAAFWLVVIWSTVLAILSPDDFRNYAMCVACFAECLVNHYAIDVRFLLVNSGA